MQKKFARGERGQVLVLVALAAVGIIAIIGLVMDVGLVFIGNARLRRAVDAAALSAALQYRENYSPQVLQDSANEFLVMNGMVNPNSTVSECDPLHPDPTLCTTPPRKLVRVHATADVQLAFLPVIGINKVGISATAVSETASLDVVLVIDRSESMTYGPDYLHPLLQTDPMRDPYYCNTPSVNGSSDGSRTYTDPQNGNPYVLTSACQPFFAVVSAAIDFTNILFFPYDQVAVVTFDKLPHVNLALTADCPGHLTDCTADLAVIPTLQNLTVFQGDESVSGGSANAIFPQGNPSRCYYNIPTDGSGNPLPWVCPICEDHPTWSPSSNYQTLLGPGQDSCTDVTATYLNPPDPSQYTTTNIGGGLLEAGNEFRTDSRQNSLWVVILLTDGVANSGYGMGSGLTVNLCPQDTWGLLPRCNHGDPTLRHVPGDTEYDASDFAYDMADNIGKPFPDGNNALLYTIGLGPEVTKYTQNTGTFADPYSFPVVGVKGEGLGTIFLNYAAAIGRGQAFYAAQPSDLTRIFTLIGTNIATRLSQ